jgi:hypothetical protein
MRWNIAPPAGDAGDAGVIFTFNTKDKEGEGSETS